MTAEWGLAAAGAVSRTFLSRIPRLARQLGPVSSTSYRLASRISNTLRAGTPVREFAGLENCDIVLFCFPHGAVASLAKPDALDWTHKVVLCCDTPNDPNFEAELRGRGAAVAEICQIGGLTDRFIVVGDRSAVRAAKAVVRSMHGRPLEVSRDRLLLFQAALTLSGSLFTPLMETAAECLRQAGLEQPEAANLAASLFQHSLRTFQHAGRKSWAGAIALAEEKTVSTQAEALHANKPLMAAYFRDAVRYSFELYQTFPELTRYNKDRWTNFRKRYKPF